MKNNSSFKDVIAGISIFITAIVLRLIYFFQMRDTLVFNNLIIDSRYYHVIATNLSQIKATFPHLIFQQHPFYVFFLNTIYTLWGVNLTPVRILQFILGAITCVFVFLIAKDFFNRPTGIIAGFITAGYLPFIFYEGEILPTFLGLFLLVVMTYFCTIFPKRKNKLMLAFLIGLISAGFVLLRGNGIFLVPFIALYIVFAVHLVKKKIAVTSLFVLGFIILIFGNTVYSYKTTGEAILISLHGGENFYLGNNIKSQGTAKAPSFVDENPFFEHKSYRDKASQILKRQVSASESSRFWLIQGLKFIIEHPFRYLRLLGKKILLLINGYEICDNNNYYFFKDFSSLLRVPLFSFYIIGPLGICGGLLAIRKWRQLALLYLIPVIYSISVIIFFVISRYRLALIPYCIIFGAHALYTFFEWIKQREFKYLIAYLGIFILAFILVSTPISIGSWNITGKLATAHYNYGHLLESKNRLEEAKEEYLKAVTLEPEFVSALMSLARIHAKKGEVLEAVQLWKNVLEIHPENIGAKRNLDLILR